MWIDINSNILCVTNNPIACHAHNLYLVWYLRHIINSKFKQKLPRYRISIKTRSMNNIDTIPTDVNKCYRVSKGRNIVACNKMIFFYQFPRAWNWCACPANFRPDKVDEFESGSLTLQVEMNADAETAHRKSDRMHARYRIPINRSGPVIESATAHWGH